MKCPIKNLESECIQKECPYWKPPCERCGLDLALEALGDIAQALSDINVTYDGRF